MTFMVVTPSSRFQSENTAGADLGFWLVRMATAAVVALVIQASKGPNAWRTTMAVLIGIVNTLVVPWVLCITLEIPAVVGVPPLMFSFWISLAAMGVLLAVLVYRMDPGSVTRVAIGGTVGLAGFALVITQFGTSAFGYEAVVPLSPNPGAASLDIRDISAGDTKLTLRYDSGLVQQAYFDKGLLRVTRPAYFRYVDYTFTNGPAGPEDSGRREMRKGATYTEAMQFLATMGFVKQAEAEISARR